MSLVRYHCALRIVDFWKFAEERNVILRFTRAQRGPYTSFRFRAAVVDKVVECVERGENVDYERIILFT